MAWMRRWPGAFPLFVDEAAGGRFTDVDGLEYVDLCLGDTGAMGGHALPAVTAAVADRAARGVTAMLPTADAAWVAGELARRFGLPAWQFALSATDANRFALRLARHATGRRKVLVFDWCYHGTVDETMVVLDGGRVVPRTARWGRRWIRRRRRWSSRSTTSMRCGRRSRRGTWPASWPSRR